MKFQVTPIYGWGWYDIKGARVEVPSPFEFEATVIEPGTPRESFTTALGQVDDTRHVLSGFWIYLQSRSPAHGHCNLLAFCEKPALPVHSVAPVARPGITGFAVVHLAG